MANNKKGGGAPEDWGKLCKLPKASFSAGKNVDGWVQKRENVHTQTRCALFYTASLLVLAQRKDCQGNLRLFMVWSIFNSITFLQTNCDNINNFTVFFNKQTNKIFFYLL